jgi:hypothetical protein
MRRLVRLVLAVAILLAAPTSLFGQGGLRAAVGGAEVDRPELDYFLSRYRGADGAMQAQAVGARLMWSLAPLQGESALLSRTSVGGYLVHSPDDKTWSGSWRYGAQADLRVTRLPLAGRVDPFLSVGVGASRVLEPGDAAERGRLFEKPSTHLSVAPGLGMRLRVTPGLGLRWDARQVLDFRDRVERNVELSGGLSLGV